MAEFATLQENADGSRLEMAVVGGARVFADVRLKADQLFILHVEADPALRGSGAAGQFMQGLVRHARERGLKLKPVCGYAVHWLSRHPEAADLLA